MRDVIARNATQRYGIQIDENDPYVLGAASLHQLREEQHQYLEKRFEQFQNHFDAAFDKLNNAHRQKSAHLSDPFLEEKYQEFFIRSYLPLLEDTIRDGQRNSQSTLKEGIDENTQLQKASLSWIWVLVLLNTVTSIIVIFTLLPHLFR